MFPAGASVSLEDTLQKTAAFPDEYVARHGGCRLLAAQPNRVDVRQYCAAKETRRRTWPESP